MSSERGRKGPFPDERYDAAEFARARRHVAGGSPPQKMSAGSAKPGLFDFGFE
jgi:hypothetical protein